MIFKLKVITNSKTTSTEELKYGYFKIKLLSGKFGVS